MIKLDSQISIIKQVEKENTCIEEKIQYLILATSTNYM